MKNRIVVIASLSLFMVVAASLVFNTTTSANPLRPRIVNSASAEREDNKTSPAAKNRAAAQAHFCQAHQKAVTKIMNRISLRGTKQAEVFNKIAGRVETFAEAHQKPANYDTLLADVNTQKNAVDTTLQAIKDSAANFSCSGTNPAGIGSTIRAEVKQETAALKQYKTAVKNLIVAVKQAQPDANSAGSND